MTTLTGVPIVLSGLQRGSMLGRYQLLEPIASGGMADVWFGRAHGEFDFERLVAIKVLKLEFFENESARAMFLREGRLMARIHHPNVVDVLDLGEYDGRLYQVLEYVNGISLRVLERRQGSPLPPAVVARIAADALFGLHAAHDLRDERGESFGLVHRDVSPQNILVRLEGRSLIADFGVAKAVRASNESDTTRTGEVRGKLGYMAPEHLSEGEVDRRADIFSMGVVLWEGLTGRRLFGGQSPVASRGWMELKGLPHPAEILPQLAGNPVSEIAMTALSRLPEERFPTADAMATALEEAGCAAARDVSRLVRHFVDDELRGKVERALAIPPQKHRRDSRPDVSSTPGISVRSASGQRPPPGSTPDDDAWPTATPVLNVTPFAPPIQAPRPSQTAFVGRTLVAHTPAGSAVSPSSTAHHSRARYLRTLAFSLGLAMTFLAAVAWWYSRKKTDDEGVATKPMTSAADETATTRVEAPTIAPRQEPRADAALPSAIAQRPPAAPASVHRRAARPSTPAPSDRSSSPPAASSGPLYLPPRANPYE